MIPQLKLAAVATSLLYRTLTSAIAIGVLTYSIASTLRRHKNGEHRTAQHGPLRDRNLRRTGKRSEEEPYTIDVR